MAPQAMQTCRPRSHSGGWAEVSSLSMAGGDLLWQSVHSWLECGRTNGTHGLVQVRPQDLEHLIWQLRMPAYQLRRSSRLRLMTGHVWMSGMPGVKSSERPVSAASVHLQPSLRSSDESGKTVLQ